MDRGNEEEILIEHGSGNVFADLGFENADELLAKAQLVRAICESMKASGVSVGELAARVDAEEAKLSRLLKGVTDGYTTDRLLRMLNSLDQDVEIIVRPRPLSEDREAHVSVRTA